MSKIHLNPDQASFLISCGTHVVTPSEREFYCLPYWYEELGKGKYNELSFENLPEELITAINRMRGGEIGNTHNHVHAFLKDCDIEILRYMELQLGFAKDVRSYQLEYSVSNSDFASEFGCEVDQVETLRRGAREISFKDMAKLRTMYAARIAEKNANIQVKK